MPVITEIVNIKYRVSRKRKPEFNSILYASPIITNICPDQVNIFAIEFVIKHPAFACRLLETQKTFSRKVP